MTQKSRPGPTGTSCLTCKQRHKKCDQRQPVCERCEAEQFECLGYGHIKRAHMPANQPTSLYLPIAPNNRGSSSQSALLWPNSDIESLADLPFSGIVDTQPISLPSKVSTSTTSSGNAVTSDLALVDSMSALPNSRTRRVEDYLYLFTTQSSFKATDSPMSILRKIINAQTQLPYSPLDPLKTFLNSYWFMEYILVQCHKIMDSWYLIPANYERNQFLNGALHGLQASSFGRWVILVAVGLIQSFLTGDMTQIIRHSYWIGHIENTVKHEMTRDLVPQEMQERRSTWVHVSLMKTMLTHSSNIYQLLRSMTPTFLQVVYSDPRLWSSGCNPTCVPMWNLLSSDTHEVASFVFIDCTCAMAFGLPQQVEYDTTIYSTLPHPPAHQWAHGTPIFFQLLLADINSCRDKSPNARKWREIEESLQTWRFQPGELSFTESWMMVAWYAVQESWRLALLVYLYMAVCNTSSDDPRVQSYIKQILQVVGTVKERGKSSSYVSFFVQYLIVGICARSEAHREIVRNRLSAQSINKLWIMRALYFVPVLDHLWHGAAAGGRPIKWGDYMHSREEVLPVVF